MSLNTTEPAAAQPSSALSALPESLLETLKQILQAQETRQSIQRELEDALSSFLSGAPASASASQSHSSTATTTVVNGSPVRSKSTCALESATIPPPNEDQLQEILRIAFVGLMQVRAEVEVLEKRLGEKFGRTDLRDVVTVLEEKEQERLRETIQRDQFRRLLFLNPSAEDEFLPAIEGADKRRKDLAEEINEQLRELAAEVADLSAAEDGDAGDS
ncbi:hypothetical protein T439DRAFT_361064 [Meredithblackwellia eburnea MCA 4105]